MMLRLPRFSWCETTLCLEDGEYEGRAFIMRWGRYLVEFIVTACPRPAAAGRCDTCGEQIPLDSERCEECLWHWAIK